MELLTCLKLWMYDQVLVRDCLHGDLHDGNWGVMLSGKEVVVYDFGMVYSGLSMGPLLMTLLRMDSVAFHAEMCRVLATDRLPLEDIHTIFQRYRERKVMDRDLIDSLMRIIHKYRIPVQSSLYVFLNLLIFIISLQCNEWMRYSPNEIIKMDLVYSRRVPGCEGLFSHLQKILL